MPRDTYWPSTVACDSKSSVNFVERLSRTNSRWAAMLELPTTPTAGSSRCPCELTDPGVSGLSGYMASDGLGHTCSLCARTFSEAKNCKRHIREKHLGLDRSVCPTCWAKMMMVMMLLVRNDNILKIIIVESSLSKCDIKHRLLGQIIG